MSPLEPPVPKPAAYLTNQDEVDASRRMGETLVEIPTSRHFQVTRFAGTLEHYKLLDHIRVAHVTDMHVGRVTPFKAQLEAVRIANAGKPDLVAITGDFVCHSQRYLDQLSEVIQAFDAPVVCVLGNHDYWCGADDVRKTLRATGAEVLDNSWTTLTLRHQPIQLVGVDDAYTGHGDVERSTKGLKPNVATLGLSHIAEEADHLWQRGVPLVLSGHTHAGQVTWARLHELSIGKIAGHKYVHGLYGARRHGVGAVYVGAGVGSAVLPWRWGQRAGREVTFFELGLAPGTFEEPHDEQPAAKGRPPSPKKRWKRHKAVVKKAAKRARRSKA